MLTLEPAGRRPRRPGLPHRAVPARRPRDLERQLVRRPLHAHLQRPLPAAGGAARPAGGRRPRGRRLLLPLRPPRPRPLGRGGALGDALVRRRRRHPARRRPAHLRPRRRLRPRRAALPAGRPRRRSARSPPRRPAPSPARSPRAFLAGVVAASRRLASGGRPVSRRRRSAPPRARASASPSSPTSPSPSRASSPSPSPPTSRSRSGAAARCSSPAACATRSASCAGCSLGYLLAATADLAGAERAGRQRGPARRPLRRPGPGRGAARPPAAPRRPGLVPRPLCDGRQPLLAGDRQRQPDRPHRRRPLDHRAPTSTRRRSWLREHGGARRADRGAADREPLGGGLPGAELRPRPRLAAPARHHPRRHLLRRREPAHRPRLPRLAARQRDLATSPCPTRRSTTPRSPSGG